MYLYLRYISKVSSPTLSASLIEILVAIAGTEPPSPGGTRSGGLLRARGVPGMKCIKIGLPGKLILSKS